MQRARAEKVCDVLIGQKDQQRDGRAESGGNDMQCRSFRPRQVCSLGGPVRRWVLFLVECKATKILQEKSDLI